ncbi:hypothetical protein [uncultured Methanolobus sp.]|uniref:hypothetical protein n=1 Tax=uncultured Methanolobus sp. TaxID=218300 RepID=UPI002AAC3B48|nr:hypothetical protein [uncultured Methanolobus sp.]
MIITKQIKSTQLIILAVFLTVALSGFASASTSVVRGVSTTSPSANSEIEITLSISDMDVGGIVETIPDGFAYVSTDHPSDQTSVNGQNVIFSVIGESKITYTVSAPSSGSGVFSGLWDNSLDMDDGTIADTSVTVKSSSGSRSSSGTGTARVTTADSSAESENTNNEETTETAEEASTEEKQDMSTRMSIQDDEGDAPSETTDADDSESKSTPFIGIVPMAILVIFSAFFARDRMNNKGGI